MSIARLLFTFAAPLVLASCLLTPGRFTSSLDIRKDRSFTFTYAGEVILLDPTGEATDQVVKVATADADAGAETTDEEPAVEEPAAAPSKDTPDMIAKRRAIAAALMKVVGYRSAVYLGQGKFQVDYRLSGTLDRTYVFPFNPDAAAIIPWVAIEVRKDGTARVKASGFGDENANNPMPAPPDQDAKKDRQGTFTFTTDAELVMHNNEEGTAPGTARKVVWQVSPATKTPPTAVVRFAG